MELEQLKRQLEQLGERNDSMQQARHRKLLNITRDTGELLSVLVQTRGAQAVLEMSGGLVSDLQGAPLRYGLDRPMLNPEFVAVGDAALEMPPMVCPETMRDHLV